MLDDRGCLGAPDLVIEILSPGNTHREMREKFELYEEAGVLEYWIVSPMSNSVLVYVPNAEGQFIGKRPFTTEDRLTSTLLPGLEIDLKEVLLHDS